MTNLLRRTPLILAGALAGLSLSWAAFAQDMVRPFAPHAGSGVAVAQYAGPPFDGPPGMGDPDGDGPPPGMGGPPGYGQGQPDGGGYRLHRHARDPSGHGAQHVVYHGFHIDLSEAGGSRNLAGQIASMEHQIDLVDSVGLSMSDLGLFRGFPIQIDTSTHGNGHYSGGPTVTMGSLSASDRRPVLLHEFMHVYHHARLPGGFQNPDIHAFYEEARSGNLYPAGSFMLTNQGEFFAMTASCYLYGTVAREPFNRETIRTHQPDYYAYLGRLFGPPHGSHSAGTRISRRMPQGGAPSEPMQDQGAY